MFDIPARYILVVLVFLGISTVPLLRVNLSIAIISMVNSSNVKASRNDSNISRYVCPGGGVEEETHESSGPFEWDSVQQGSVLGSYFYLYIVSSALGPWIASRVGFKLVVGIAVTLSSVVTLATPLVAYQGIGFVIATRILLGGFQGAVMPGMLLALPPWIPAKDVSFVYSLVVCGYPLGIFVTLPLSSLIAENLGWEAVFYISGGISLLWCVLWFLLVYDSPGDHPRISEGEKKYLEKHPTRSTASSKIGNERVPWIKILTTLPVWAILLAHIALDWTITITTVLVPSYLASVLNMNITKVGISSGFPFLIGVIVIIFTGKLSDILRDHTRLSLITIRKMYATVALGGPGICIMCLSYVGCNGAAATALLLATVELMQLHFTGTEVNVFDLSPTYCGIIYGVAQGVSLSTGFLAPLIAGFILQKNDLLFGWQIIFWISAAINFSAAVFYLIFGSTKEQNWSKEKQPPAGKEHSEEDKCLSSEEDSGISSFKV